jgi:hypothetical protein
VSTWAITASVFYIAIWEAASCRSALRAGTFRESARHAEGLVDGEPLGVQGNLGENLALRIQTKSIKEEKGINQNVRNLIRDVHDIEFARVVSVLSPLKKLKELTGLDTDGYSEILGRVKLRPIPLVPKFSKSFKKLVHRNLHFEPVSARIAPADFWRYPDRTSC